MIQLLCRKEKKNENMYQRIVIKNGILPEFILPIWNDYQRMHFRGGNKCDRCDSLFTNYKS